MLSRGALYCSSSLCQQHGWLLRGILTRELSKMPSKGVTFPKGLGGVAFTSQRLVTYLLLHWSNARFVGEWVGRKHRIAAFSTKSTH